jgi:hypothetical protein
MQQPVGMRDGSNLQFLVVRMHKVAQIIQCETMRKRNKSSFHSSKIAMQTDTDGASSQIILESSEVYHWHSGRQVFLIYSAAPLPARHGQLQTGNRGEERNTLEPSY